jgi:hypothetical protein
MISVHRLIHRKWGSRIHRPHIVDNRNLLDFFSVSSGTRTGEEDIARRNVAKAAQRRKEWEEDAPTESDRYGGDLGRILGFPVQAGLAHHPQRLIPC